MLDQAQFSSTKVAGPHRRNSVFAARAVERCKRRKGCEIHWRSRHRGPPCRVTLRWRTASSPCPISPSPFPAPTSMLKGTYKLVAADSDFIGARENAGHRLQDGRRMEGLSAQACRSLLQERWRRNRSAYPHRRHLQESRLRRRRERACRTPIRSAPTSSRRNNSRFGCDARSVSCRAPFRIATSLKRALHMQPIRARPTSSPPSCTIRCYLITSVWRKAMDMLFLIPLGNWRAHLSHLGAGQLFHRQYRADRHHHAFRQVPARGRTRPQLESPLLRFRRRHCEFAGESDHPDHGDQNQRQRLRHHPHLRAESRASRESLRRVLQIV